MTPEQVYLLLFALLLVEGVGIPGIPFEAAFLAAGYFIQNGQMTLLGATMVGAVGNLLGNLVGYWLGAKTVPVLFKRFLNKRNTAEGQGIAFRYFEKYGALVVVISRWFGIIRTPTILGAASMGMKPLPYALYSFIGAFTWTLAWQYASWKGIDLIQYWWHRLLVNNPWRNVLVLLLVVVLVAGVLCLYYLKSKRKQAR